MNDRAFAVLAIAVIINSISIFLGFQRISNLESAIQELTN